MAKFTKISVYLIVGGFFFYILLAMIQAFFIYELPMSKDWYVDGAEYENSSGATEEIVTDFKNDTEMYKYYHNQSMTKRNSYIIWGSIIFALLPTTFFFYYIPKWRGKKTIFQEPFVAIFFISFIISSVMPHIFSAILPPPINWMPKFIREYHESKVQYYLDLYSK